MATGIWLISMGC